MAKEELKEKKEEEKKEEPAKETITLPKEEYLGILDRIGKLERGEVNEDYLDAEDTKYVHVRHFNGWPVIELKKPIVEKFQNNSKVLYVDFVALKEGKPEEFQMKYLDYMRELPRELLKVVEEKVTPRRSQKGMTEVKEVKEYKTVGTGVKVPLRVVSEERSFVVELKDGTTVEILENAIN